MVLEALVPCYLQKLKSNTVTMESASAARDEIAAIAALATSLQALLYSSEALTRSASVFASVVPGGDLLFCSFYLQCFKCHPHLLRRPMTAPQMSRCDQGHKGGTTANHAMSGGVNTRSGGEIREMSEHR